MSGEEVSSSKVLPQERNADIGFKGLMVTLVLFLEQGEELPNLLDLFEWALDGGDDCWVVEENCLLEKDDHTLFNNDGKGEEKYFSRRATKRFKGIHEITLGGSLFGVDGSLRLDFRVRTPFILAETEYFLVDPRELDFFLGL